MKTKVTDTLSNELTHYVCAWKRLNFQPKTIVKAHINCNEFITFINEFEPQYKKYLLSDNAINIWDVCCIGSNELKHSQVLSWLLDCKGSHGFGNQFFHYLIDYLNTRSNITIMSVTTAQLENSYLTKTETSYIDSQNTKNSRVDIEIENKEFLVFIEVKVDALETNDQLIRYYQLGNMKSELDSNKPWELIFLTKHGNKPIERQDVDYQKMLNKVTCLSWQEIACLLRRFSATQSSRPFLQKVLNQYHQYIRKYFTN